MAGVTNKELRELVDRHIGRVFNFCRRMSIENTEAVEATYQTFARAAKGPLPDGDEARQLRLLQWACDALSPLLSPAPEVSFEMLDETLRSEATRTGEVASLTNPQRDFLLWELKQGCMTAVVNCLPPGERVAFVISSVMSMSDEEGARVLGIKESAFKVRLSRARKKVGDYLAPRCEHVDPRNPCHCPSRIGIALSKGFIAPPPSKEMSLRKSLPFIDDQRKGDAVAIYRTLPEPEPPIELRARIDTAVQTGQW